jgi:Protein of unknown function (DUF3237)
MLWLPIESFSANSGVATKLNIHPPLLGVEYAFTANVRLGEIRILGRGPEGIRRFIPIIGGAVEGPDLTGHVIAAGGDSQTVRSDNVIVLEARYMIQAADGTLLSVVNRGYRHSTPEIMARLANGEPVNPEDYYFRTVAHIEAPIDSRYERFNRLLFVGTAERTVDAAIVHFYRIS